MAAAVVVSATIISSVVSSASERGGIAGFNGRGAKELLGGADGRPQGLAEIAASGEGASAHPVLEVTLGEVEADGLVAEGHGEASIAFDAKAIVVTSRACAVPELGCGSQPSSVGMIASKSGCARGTDGDDDLLHTDVLLVGGAA
ncbi:MAG TPA: hypothetical protein VLK58_07435 [Conexibacter sp.]|nr:hypothetical protein [Conexibacter sp.]